MKNIKKIIIFLTILLIVLIGILITIYMQPLNKELSYIYNEHKQGKINIMPTNVSYLFEKYEGDINQRSIYKALDMYVNEKIEKYNKELSIIDSTGLNQYYQENSKTIFKELGLENKEDFESFINEVRKLSGDLVLDSYTIYPKKAKRSSDYIEAIILINYNNNNNNDKVAFKIRVSNKENKQKTPICLLGNVDEKYYEYEYKTPTTNSSVDSPGKTE